ncbi:MAG: ECF transporter S component [Candidatus Dormibacteraceae bacterium]
MRVGLVSLLGLALFLWPFSGLGLPGGAAALAIALAAGGALLLMELAARQMDARALALLAAIAGMDAALRLVLVTGIGGFSPIFFLILCAGYAFGASFGFLAGSLCMLVSALATGGIGPWLPYQLFAAGWVGVAAGLLGTPGRGRPPQLRDLVALAAVGAVAGFGFGAVMDLWDWTFFRSSPDLGWSPGMPALTALGHFGKYYLATSIVYDAFRAGGNALLALALGAPVLAALARFRGRFTLEIVEALPPAA